MLVKIVTLGVVTLLLVSCTTTPHVGESPAQSSRLGLRLAPADLGAEIALQQHLTVERHGRTDQLDVALEVDATDLNLVGLALGQRVLTMHYDGKELTSWRHVMLPSQVKAEDVLEDLQLTFWPVDAIRRALPSGWRIEDNDLQRALYKDDELICLIHYSTMPRWSGTVQLENLRFKYAITIQIQSNN